MPDPTPREVNEAAREIAGSPDLLEVGRKAVEDALIDMRDRRIFLLRNNGLVVSEKDGKKSDVIRLGPEDCLRIGLKAIADYIQLRPPHPPHQDQEPDQ